MDGTKEIGMGKGRLPSGSVPFAICELKVRPSMCSVLRQFITVDWRIKVSDRLRLNVCNHRGICVPVRFQVDLEGIRADVMSDEVQELVDAIYRADDALEEVADDDD